jgi:RimJ/RimL family protein N-acetyltransferase
MVTRPGGRADDLRGDVPADGDPGAELDVLRAAAWVRSGWTWCGSPPPDRVDDGMSSLIGRLLLTRSRSSAPVGGDRAWWPSSPPQMMVLVADTDARTSALAHLRFTLGALSLQYVQPEHAAALGEILAADLLPPEQRYFIPGLFRSLADTPEQTSRNVVAYHRQVQKETGPDRWDLPLALVLEGRVVGSQALHAVEFPDRGEVSSGSYLISQVRGQGLGTLMRAMALEFAFTTLNARAAVTSHAVGNHASGGVSRKLGYELVGYEEEVRYGQSRRIARLRLSRERWREARPPAIAGLSVVGLDDVLPLLTR